VKLNVSALPVPGAKFAAADGVRFVNVVPSVLPWMLRVSVRAPQATGTFSTTRLMLVAAPRSTRNQFGYALGVPSQ
jgi:hypothetical protein